MDRDMLESVKPEVIDDPHDAVVTKLSAVQALDNLVHRIPWPAAGTLSYDEIVSREWLVTNGLGGYASGTVAGAITRRYHAPLIAALPAPHGRVVMLNHFSERVRLPDRSVVWLGVHSDEGKFAQTEGTQHLVEFRLEAGLPVWRYRDRKYHDREAPVDDLRPEHRAHPLSDDRRQRARAARPASADQLPIARRATSASRSPKTTRSTRRTAASKSRIAASCRRCA